jgi:hypothetical protein
MPPSLPLSAAQRMETRRLERRGIVIPLRPLGRRDRQDKERKGTSTRANSFLFDQANSWAIGYVDRMTFHVSLIA